MPWQHGRNSGVATLNPRITISRTHLYAWQAISTCTADKAEGQFCKPVVLQGLKLVHVVYAGSWTVSTDKSPFRILCGAGGKIIRD